MLCSLTYQYSESTSRASLGRQSIITLKAFEGLILRLCLHCRVSLDDCHLSQPRLGVSVSTAKLYLHYCVLIRSALTHVCPMVLCAEMFQDSFPINCRRTCLSFGGIVGQHWRTLAYVLAAKVPSRARYSRARALTHPTLLPASRGLTYLQTQEKVFVCRWQTVGLKPTKAFELTLQ